MISYTTYDIVRLAYDIVCWHTTSYVMYDTYDVVYDMNLWYRMLCTYDVVGPFRTYDIVYDMFKWQPTMSYVSDTMSYVLVRHHTYIRCRTYDVVRLYPVYRTYDIARTIFNTMSYVARTMSYFIHVRHRTYVRHRRWQESRWNKAAHPSGTPIFSICLVTTHVPCICCPHQYTWNIRGVSMDIPWIYHVYRPSIYVVYPWIYMVYHLMYIHGIYVVYRYYIHGYS
jgi:hypothetical protein